jgi:hypothetical protein
MVVSAIAVAPQFEKCNKKGYYLHISKFNGDRSNSE